ncbi:glycosyl transferase 2 family protein [Arcobacter sp. FW59]|nr:glycosyl transferase 2 family protein [Arcobacter sp. FW59]
MLKTQPLVSIFTPVYNAEEYIIETIESIITQEYTNIEIIISDDASTDKTPLLLKELENKYPNIIRLFLQKTNLGITKNCNFVLKQCKGKYIAFFAGDDLMLPSKIKKQVEYMENNEKCSICYHNLEVFESQTSKHLYYFNDSKNKYEGEADMLIKFGTFNGGCSNMVRRECIPEKGYNEIIPIASDWFFWIDILANSKGTINYIDEVLGKYRRHSSNITLLNQGNIEQFITLSITESKYPYLLKYIRIKRSMMYYSLGIKSILDGDRKQGRIYFKESIYHNIFNFKSYLRYLWSIVK